MKFRGLFRISVISVAAFALVGLSACADPKKTPTYVCDSGVTGTSAPPAATPPPPDEPLAAESAGEEAKVAVAEAQVLTSDGRVPLVTVEQTPAGPEITTTPVANEAEAEAVAEAAAVDGDLVAVEPDSIVTADVADPDDPEFDAGQQYALARVGFDVTWDDAFSGVRSGAGQTVAVVDTGVQASHQDLSEAGRVLQGMVFGQPAPATHDHFPGGHGTRVAGIIAAETDNGIGIAGAAPATTILPVKVLDPAGKGFSTDVAAGIRWAADNGADVINLSLGGSTPSQAMRAQILYTLGLGVPVIAAAGNTGKCGSPSFPAAFSEVLAVGATDISNQLATFSTTAPYLDVVAPGVAVRSTSTSPPNSFTDKDGTSFSTPYVSAAAAIVRATHPSFDANQIVFRLITTATDLGSPGWDPHFGAGLISVPAAAA